MSSSDASVNGEPGIIRAGPLAPEDRVAPIARFAAPNCNHQRPDVNPTGRNLA